MNNIVKTISATADEKDEGRKLKYFARGDMGVSYHQFSALKMTGGLRVNGEIARADYILHAGDKVEIQLIDTARETAKPEDGNVNIVYEDDDILIIDKPAPLACQAGIKNPTGTLENRLAAKYGDGFVFRPLNRLDKGTSGLMAAAKHAHACQIMQRQLHTPDFVREYLAVVEGTMSGEGTINLPIIKADGATVRRVVDVENGQSAITHYRVEQAANNRSLVRLRLETGRTHQIRVHLSHTGFPICGDFLYGTEINELPQRFALHSTRLTLVHPITKEKLTFTSELPEELKLLLKT